MIPALDLVSGRRQADNPANLAHATEETTMRQAFLYYLVQTLTAAPHRQARRDAEALAPSPAGPARGKETPPLARPRSSGGVVRG